MSIKEHPDWTEVFTAYDITPDMIQEVTPSVWKITSAQGEFVLKATDISEKKLEFITSVLDSAVSLGATNILPFVKTANSEKAFVATNNCCFYMTPWQSHAEVYDAKELIVSLAKLHRICEPIITGCMKWQNHFGHQELMDWKRKEIRLAGFCDDVNERPFKSPFDKAFLEMHNELEKSLLFAIRAAERFIEKEDGIAPRYTFCHTRLHCSNIVGESSQFYFVDFDNAMVDTPVRDLATFLRRSMLNQTDSQVELEELLALYEKENPLSQKEKRLLALSLAYPERPFNVIETYYRQEPIEELVVLQKFERELDHFDSLRGLIVKLWEEKSKLKAATKTTAKSSVKPKRKKS